MVPLSSWAVVSGFACCTPAAASETAVAAVATARSARKIRARWKSRRRGRKSSGHLEDPEKNNYSIEENR